MYISFLTIALPLAFPTMAQRLPPRTFRVVICSDSLEISPTSCVIINVNLKLIHNIYIYIYIILNNLYSTQLYLFSSIPEKLNTKKYIKYYCNYNFKLYIL